MNSLKFKEGYKNFRPSKLSKYFWMFSGAIILVGLIMLVTLGFNLGMDFTGGNVINIQTKTDITDSQYKDIVNTAEGILNEQGIKLSQSQKQGETGEIIVSIQYQNKAGVEDMSEINNAIVSALEEEYTEYTIVPAETKGATASAELLQNALLAIFIAMIFLLIYIACRFEFFSGISALVTLFHDVLVMCAFVLICRIEINSAFVAAVITVLGYSINNTIIIFDRVRENSKKPSLNEMSNKDIADLSVRQTLSRTISTSLTTLVAVLLLVIFGVPQMREFVLPIFIGIIAGTYSSIFMAAQLWTNLMSRSKHNIRNRLSKQKKKDLKTTDEGVVEAVATPTRD